MTKIACCQFEPKLGEVQSNVDETLRLFASAVDSGAEVVVFPELANCGYAFTGSAEASLVAEPLDGNTDTKWKEAADQSGSMIIAGFCESNGTSAPFNSAVLIEPGKAPVVYRKAHLWDAEPHVFTRGDAIPPVVETAHGRIAVAICYDLEFPEWVRSVALRGADLVCAPVNWPRMPRPAGERPGEVVRVQAQAAMNRMAIAACDRSGFERGISWTAASVIADADGWPVAIADTAEAGSQTIFADIDLAKSRNKRLTERSDVFADRRTDLYGDGRTGAT